VNPWIQRILLVGLVVAAIAHVGFFGTWVVEDAAISFSYARNFADGHGLVPWVGGERVEGYSNPTWVAVLVLGELIGIGSFWTSKGVSFLLCGLSVLMVHRLARHVSPDSPVVAPLAAAGALAVNTQFAIFGAAGLENSLFTCLLALALLLSVQEVEEEGFPHSAWVWLLIALTRPEGIAYAAFGGLWAMLASMKRGRGTQPTVKWLIAFFAPFFIYHAIRYAYFAYPFPMTAYAKVNRSPMSIVRWTGKGFRYLRLFGYHTWQGWLVPIYLIGAMGVTGWRLRAAGAVFAGGLACALLPPEGYESFASWGNVRGVLLFALATVAALPQTDTATGYLRSLAAALGLFSCFFAVFSMGDWMDGYRWLAMAAVPGALLFALGLDEIGRWVGKRGPALYWCVMVAGLAVFSAGQIRHSQTFSEKLEISPYMVRKRVVHANSLYKTLFIDERAGVFTVDMGGFMWWSEMELADRVGLTDVSVAMNRRTNYGRFIIDYLYTERRPHFIQVGDHIAVLRKNSDFDAEYVTVNPMTYVRRDLMFDEEWPYGNDRRISLLGGVEISGWATPSLPAATGDALYLEIGLRKRGPSFKAKVMLFDKAGEAVARWPLELGYGFHLPKDWYDDSVYHGRYPLTLPDDLSVGTYRLGLALVSVEGALAPVDPESLPEGVELNDDGVLIFADAIEVAAAEDVDRRASERADEAVALATETQCADAKRSWFVARQYRRNSEIAEVRGAELDRVLAECWVAAAAGDDERQVEYLERARRLAPDNPVVLAAANKLASELYKKGRTAHSNKNWGRSFRSFSDAVRLEPHRSWARKYAEEARAHRLAGEGGVKKKKKDQGS